MAVNTYRFFVLWQRTQTHAHGGGPKELAAWPVQELNDVFAQTETDAVVDVLGHAVREKYRGYGLPELTRDCGVERVRKAFPLNVAEIRPWWDKIKNPDERPYL